MDITFLLQGQRFVWNEAKAAANLAKHGVAFEKACEVFFDPFLHLVESHVEGEARTQAIGLTEDWNLLCVIYAVRLEDTIRIISARPATTPERRQYEND